MLIALLAGTVAWPDVAMCVLPVLVMFLFVYLISRS